MNDLVCWVFFAKQPGVLDTGAGQFFENLPHLCQFYKNTLQLKPKQEVPTVKSAVSIHSFHT